ncbi:MAG: hypothetical protein ABI811_21270 [Acidobacteriota bacterium]
MEDNITTIRTEPKSGSAGKWVAGGVIGALVIAGGFLFHRVNTLETDLSTQRATSQAQLTELREATASSAVAMNKNFGDFAAQLQEGTRTTTAVAQLAAAQAQSNAQKNAEKLVQQLAEQQRVSDDQFAKQIGDVKTVNEEQSAKVTGLESNIGNVKETVGTVQEAVNQTKSTLDLAIADLKSARGDLGVQSGLIATNSKELGALRELGERTYFEFTLKKGAAPTKVGNVQLALKKVDVKRNKYNVNVMADDKLVEKKDRTINEPVQMYVSGARQPYEIVVNEVKKDTVVGYIAVPKVLRAAR